METRRQEEVSGGWRERKKCGDEWDEHGGIGVRGICPEVIILFPRCGGWLCVLRKVLVSCYQHSLSDLVVFPQAGLQVLTSDPLYSGP